MSAIVCGKRSFFEDLHTPPPSSAAVKRLRRTAGSSPVRLSPPRPAFSSLSPSSSDPSPISHLIALFPDMDQQVFFPFGLFFRVLLLLFLFLLNCVCACILMLGWFISVYCDLGLVSMFWRNTK